MKRILSVILSLTMILSYMPAMAFAEDSIPPEDGSVSPMGLDEEGADAGEEMEEGEPDDGEDMDDGEGMEEGEPGDGDEGMEEGEPDDDGDEWGDEGEIGFFTEHYYEDYGNEDWGGYLVGTKVTLPDLTAGENEGVTFEWYKMTYEKYEDEEEGTVWSEIWDEEPFAVTEDPSIDVKLTYRYHNFKCVATQVDEFGDKITLDSAYYEYAAALAMPLYRDSYYVTPGNSVTIDVELGEGVEVLGWDQCGVTDEEWTYEPIEGLEGASIEYTPETGDNLIACRVRCVEDGQEYVNHVIFSVQCTFFRDLKISASPERMFSESAFVDAGETATFKVDCKADPQAELKYQWYVSRDDYPYTPEWAYFHDGIDIDDGAYVELAGETSDTLEITPEKSVFVKCVITATLDDVSVDTTATSDVWVAGNYNKTVSLDSDVDIATSEGLQYVTFTAPEAGFYNISVPKDQDADLDMKPVLICFIGDNWVSSIAGYDWVWDEETGESQVLLYPSIKMHLDQGEEFRIYAAELGAIDQESHVDRVFSVHADNLGADYECEHDWDMRTWVGRRDATCTEPGNDGDYTCLTCGAILEEGYEYGPYGHSPVPADIKATCEESGTNGRTVCESCGEVVDDGVEIEALGHTPETQAAKEPTCEEAGSTGKTVCTVCNKVLVEAEEIPALGHDYVSKKVAAKVGIAGKSYDECTRCNDVKNVVVIKALNPAKTSITSLKSGKKSFTVKWSKKAYTGYQIKYSTKSSMSGAKYVTITKSSTVSKTVKNLKARKKYYVQIRTYKTVNGKKCYSAWSTKKSVTTK